MAFDPKGDWSAADVSALLACVEEDSRWRLEVTSDGIAKLNDLTTIPEAVYEASLHCFFEVWDQGTNFVGHGAASDKNRRKTFERKLRENYPELKGPRTLSAL